MCVHRWREAAAFIKWKRYFLPLITAGRSRPRPALARRGDDTQVARDGIRVDGTEEGGKTWHGTRDDGGQNRTNAVTEQWLSVPSAEPSTGLMFTEKLIVYHRHELRVSPQHRKTAPTRPAWKSLNVFRQNEKQTQLLNNNNNNNNRNNVFGHLRWQLHFTNANFIIYSKLCNK